VPEDVAALIDAMTADETAVTLVNLSPTRSREIVIQGGGYGEHPHRTAAFDGKTQTVNASAFTLKLAPGAGTRVVLAMDRYVNPPTLKFPWDR
jgi:hypothetical protein